MSINKCLIELITRDDPVIPHSTFEIIAIFALSNMKATILNVYSWCVHFSLSFIVCVCVCVVMICRVYCSALFRVEPWEVKAVNLIICAPLRCTLRNETLRGGFPFDKLDLINLFESRLFSVQAARARAWFSSLWYYNCEF